MRSISARSGRRTRRRSIEAQERSTLFLLDPQAGDPFSVNFPQRVRAEIHERTTAPLFTLAFGLIALAFLGRPHSNRQDRGAAIACRRGALPALRTAGFAATAVGRNLNGAFRSCTPCRSLGIALRRLRHDAGLAPARSAYRREGIGPVDRPRASCRRALARRWRAWSTATRHDAARARPLYRAALYGHARVDPVRARHCHFPRRLCRDPAPLQRRSKTSHALVGAAPRLDAPAVSVRHRASLRLPLCSAPQPPRTFAQAGAGRRARKRRVRVGLSSGACGGSACSWAHSRRVFSIRSPSACRKKPKTCEAELSGRAAWGGGHWFRQESDAGPSIIYAGSADIDSLTLFGVTAFVFDNAGKFREKVASAKRQIRRTPGGCCLMRRPFSAAAAPHLATEYELPTELYRK